MIITREIALGERLEQGRGGGCSAAGDEQENLPGAVLGAVPALALTPLNFSSVFHPGKVQFLAGSGREDALKWSSSSPGQEEQPGVSPCVPRGAGQGCWGWLLCPGCSLLSHWSSSTIYSPARVLQRLRVQHRPRKGSGAEPGVIWEIFAAFLA